MTRALWMVVGIAALALTFWLGVLRGREPTWLYVAPADEPNLVQWQQDWRKAGNSIVTAAVVSNTGDQLYVYVDFIYSGDQGDQVTTCGGIRMTGQQGNWSCSPVGVKKGRGFFMLRFGLADTAAQLECSDKIIINLYSKDRGTFFEQEFPFEKIWVKVNDTLKGKLQQSLWYCPKTF
jgi:hypothetical protein